MTRLYNDDDVNNINCVLILSAFTMEQDIPDYDMDSEDEKWINTQAKKMDLTPLEVFTQRVSLITVINNLLCC